ncbi:MAG TPA: OadG family protein [Candidatus Fimivivens faecavium]|nr:OadG family protein [Candidatus Fimivivens faecavium]
MMQAFIDAIVLAILGMGIVLFVLWFLCMVMVGMGVVFGDKKKKPISAVTSAAAPVVSAPAAPVEDDGEIMAVITAAIAACLSGSSQLVVRPYASSAPESAWTMAAKTQILK